MFNDFRQVKYLLIIN